MFAFVDIPKELCSSETGRPFTSCLVCNNAFEEYDEYMVEKAVRKYNDYGVQDTVFEYAVCMDCYATLSAGFSEESRERLDAYFRERVDPEARQRYLAEYDSDDMKPRLGTCMVTGVRVEELEEYQIVGHCIGDRLVVGPAPFMIGGPAIDEIVGLLSAKTVDALGGLRDQYFGLPPEFEPHVLIL